MSVHSEPLVSIVTPVYNGALYLRDCIESILAQTYSNWEYVIVNNCSTDETLEIASSYSAKDSRIRVHTNKEFVPVIDNHNIAFNLVSPKARYCKVVCADDFIFPNCILRMVEVAEANPSVGVVGSYQLSRSAVRWQGFKYPHHVVPGRELGRQMFLGKDQVFIDGQPLFGFGSPTSLMYRTDLVRSTKTFFPNASPHADTSACFYCLQTSNFGFVFEILSYERTHEESQTAKSREINRYLSSTLSDLLEYGAYYLNKQELKERLDEALRVYHRFLAVNYFAGSRSKDFWYYHRTTLLALGYPLTRWTLLKAALRTVLEESVNPGHALGKVRRRLFPTRNDADDRTESPELSMAQTLRKV